MTRTPPALLVLAATLAHTTHASAICLAPPVTLTYERPADLRACVALAVVEDTFEQRGGIRVTNNCPGFVRIDGSAACTPADAPYEGCESPLTVEAGAEGMFYPPSTPAGSHQLNASWTVDGDPETTGTLVYTIVTEPDMPCNDTTEPECSCRTLSHQPGPPAGSLLVLVFGGVGMLRIARRRRPQR